MSVGGNVEEEKHAVARKIKRLRPLNLCADVRVVKGPWHMYSPKQLGFTKKNAPFLCKVNMAELGSARRAVDESFSGGSVNLENNWRRKEFMELSADVFKPESRSSRFSCSIDFGGARRSISMGPGEIHISLSPFVLASFPDDG